MFSNPNQVIVSTEHGPQALVHAFYVHHRDFPEVCVEGESLEAAAARLADRLSLSLEHAPSLWRQEGIMLAIADVRAFAEENRQPHRCDSSAVDRVSVLA